MKKVLKSIGNFIFSLWALLWVKLDEISLADFIKKLVVYTIVILTILCIAGADSIADYIFMK